MRRHVIKLVDRFTDAPGGRYRLHGDHSGEQFREELLEPALRDYDEVTVDLDKALGLPASFLDEAFGTLAAEVEAGKLKFILTDNNVAHAILMDCLRKHRAAAA